MPGIIDTFALLVVAAVGPTTVLGANLLYLGTLASVSKDGLFLPAGTLL